jgi:Tfp pilus assembly protein PilN
MIYLRTSLGVEIRGEDLRISCLQSNLSGGVFTHFKRIGGYRSRERAEVRSEIDTYFKSQKIPRENITLGVPRSDLILRYLDLPSEVVDNLKQVILYQVQSFEPTEEEKFYYDFAPLRADANARRLQVLLVMIRKSILDSHLKEMTELGIRPSRVTASSVALANLFLQNRKGVERKTFILADIAFSGIDLITVRDGNLVYSREAPISEGAGWKDVLLREIEEAAGKVRLGPDDSIEKIMLAGEPAEGIQQELSQELGDCELLARDLRFEMPASLKPHVAEATSSLGLAYSGLVRKPPVKLNLLPPELRIHQTRWAYVPAIVLGVAIVGLLAGLGMRQIIQDRILLRKLDDEIQALKPRMERVQAIRGQAQDLEKRIGFIEGLLHNRDMNLEVLQELTTILPSDTFLNSYQNDQGSIQISGSSSSAPDLIPKLENSRLLRDVVQRGTIFKDAQSGKDRFTFEAKLERRP